MKAKLLILKVCVLAILLVAAYFGAIYNTSQGVVDEYYSKFTHKSGSLIVGLSRAHDGISPMIIENKFGDKINQPVLNFAFQKNQSPYGEALLNAIKQKIDTVNSNGLFILSVSPGNFLMSKKIKDEFSKNLDKNALISKMTKFNSFPNYEYIRNCYGNSLYKDLLKNAPTIREIHPDGWIEFKSKLGNYTVSKNEIKFWKHQNRQATKKVAQYERISTYRVSALEKTIKYLNKYGTVVLVRIPIDKDFIDLENQFWPSFDLKMENISSLYNVLYLNYSDKSSEYKTYDGSHMFGESAKKFTEQLCDDIKNYPKN